MTKEIIIDYKKECSNLLAEKNALLCRYEEIREQLKQAENTVNECHKYLAELEDKIKSLEQENKELKKQIEADKGLITVGGKQQYEYLQRIDELEQENKDLKELNKKICEDWEKEIKVYWNALEEIRKIVTSAFAKQRPYKEDFAEIENIINEVLNG